MTNSNDGYFVTPPAAIEFGSVPVGTTVTKCIPYSWFVESPVLSASGSASSELFLNGLVPIADGSGAHWTLSFSAQSAGPKSATVNIGTMQGCVFPPNTFQALGTGARPVQAR